MKYQLDNFDLKIQNDVENTLFLMRKNDQENINNQINDIHFNY